MTTCDARHDGHDCTRPGACTAALIAMCDRVTARSNTRHDHPRSTT